MYKFMLSLGLLVSLIFSGTAWAQTNDRPHFIKAVPGTSVKKIAAEYKISVDQLLRLNYRIKARPGHALLPWEEVNVNPSTDPSWMGMTVWQFGGANPFGPSLVPLYERGLDERLHQELRSTALAVIDSLLDSEVGEMMRTMVQIQDPKIIRIHSSKDSPFIVDNMMYGGFNVRKDSTGKVVYRSKVKTFRGGVILLPKDKHGNPIPWQYAAVWDPVRLRGMSREYRLMVFLGCQNGSTTSNEVESEPIVVVVPETTYVPEPPLPETTTVVPTLPETTSVVVPPDTVITNPLYVTDCVWWLTGERSQLDPNGHPYADRHAENLFLGHEHAYWTSAYKRLGIRYRAAEARFNLGSTNARSGDYNLGLVVVPKSTSRLRLDLEGGVWYSAAERAYYLITEPTPGVWQWNPRKITVDGFGPYVRGQAVFPLRGYIDYKYRTGKLLTQHGGFITLRPGKLYLKVGDDFQVRHSVTRHVQGELSFSADSMSMREARLGFAWTSGFMTYASWNRWKYDSDNYDFLWEGPGGGLEWYFRTTTAWRFDASVIRFHDRDTAYWMDNNILVPHRTETGQWRIKLGLVYSPGTRYHFPK